MLNSNPVAAFDLSNIQEEDETEYVTLTLWVPKTAKEKYDRIQDLSHKKYSKHLKAVVVSDIDSVKIDE